MSAALKVQALDRICASGVSALRRPGLEQTIVFLHGIGGSAESFEEILSLWPAGPELIAWDAPGYGKSPPLAADWPEAQDYAEKLAGFLDAIHADRIGLAGHSLGCQIAAAFACRYPGRLSKLALIAPALGYGAAPGGALPEAVQARVSDLEQLGPEKFAEARAARLVHNVTAVPRALAQVRRIMASVNLHGYAQASRMLACGDLVALAAGIRTPALVLTGAEDRITPPEGSRRLAAALGADCGYAEIPGAGHAVTIEKSRDALAVLARFFGSAA